jgi:protein-S-isoprenylcysteine O-methyltransferase Ste14
MVFIALVLDLVFILVAFGARTILQRHRTGDSGWRLGRPHSPGELAARVLLVGAAVLLALSVLTTIPGRAGTTTGTAPSVLGAVAALAGIALAWIAQLQMGASWRIGIDADERTELIRGGVYRQIRNPIYLGMVVFVIGQVGLLPSAWTVAAAVALFAGAEIQVRAVEEPYLGAVHSAEFDRWAAQAGRFIPRVGRLRPPPQVRSADQPV